MELKKIVVSKASDVCSDIELDPQAMKLLNGELSPGDFLEKLLELNHNYDAARFLARALPRREATWWACLSARHVASEETDPEHINVLTMAEEWVFKPTDDRRHAVNDAAQKLPSDSPIYWAAMATFWSGGSLAPSDISEVLPAEHLCGMAVSGAVALAAVTEDGQPDEERYELFFKQGVAIANGDNAKQITA